MINIINYTVSKEKNFIYFTRDFDKEIYCLDVNTGLFYNSHKEVLSNEPEGFKEWLISLNLKKNITQFFPFLILMCDIATRADNEKNFLQRLSKNPINSYLNLLDRMINVGYLYSPEDFYVLTSYNILETINKNFKNFSKCMRMYEKSSLAFFCEVYLKDLFFRSITTKHKQYKLSNWQLEFLWTYYSTYEQQLKDNENIIIYFITHNNFEDYYENFPSSGYRQLKDFFEMCQQINYKPQKTNFFLQYITVKHNYKVYLKATSEDKLKQNYASKAKALKFNYENFCSIIPINSEDFLTEAQNQHNCVYSSYFIPCCNKETYIVFIRNKNNINKSLITCEVTLEGKIKQYLAFDNKEVFEPELLEFKNAYQEWLNNNWN